MIQQINTLNKNSNTVTFGKSDAKPKIERAALTSVADSFETGSKAAKRGFFSEVGKFGRRVATGTAFLATMLTGCQKDPDPVPITKEKTSTEVVNDFLGTIGFNNNLKSGEITTAPAGLDTAFIKNSDGFGMGFKFNKMSADGKTLEWFTTDVLPSGKHDGYGKVIGHAETAADGTQNFIVDYYSSADGIYKGEKYDGPAKFKFKKLDANTLNEILNGEDYSNIAKKAANEAEQIISWSGIVKTIQRLK